MFKNQKTILLFVGSFLFYPAANAASNDGFVIVENQKNMAEKVIGKISDANGNPLPGVTVTVKGSSVATVSDRQGNYAINVPSNKSILVFSLIGYTPIEKTAAKSTIDVVLSE